MSTENPFTKANLNSCLSALAKEFRKLNGTAMSAEVVLVGGASILANYGFRDITYDVDAVIHASSAMKDAINRVSDKLHLPNGWLNTDFKNTTSYSSKLFEVSVYYRTFSNVLTVRTIAAEYLVAMKLMSGRQYKNDLSDIVGILWEHEKQSKPISVEAIHHAVNALYGGWTEIPDTSRNFLRDVLANGNYGALHAAIRKDEQAAKEALLHFDENYPGALNEESISSILEQAKNKRAESRPSLLAHLEEHKEITQKANRSKPENPISLDDR